MDTFLQGVRNISKISLHICENLKSYQNFSRKVPVTCSYNLLNNLKWFIENENEYLQHNLRKILSTRMPDNNEMFNYFPGCGTQFAPYINDEMMKLIYRSLRHTNRFVRESGFQTCSTLIEAASEDVYAKFGVTFAQHLAEGLSDNWSQVRLAATTATRQV